MSIDGTSYVVYNPKNKLFWNNDSGWGSLAGATRFTLEETDSLRLPIDGEWLTDECAKICESKQD